MVAVSNKELLSGYLMTLKLKQAIDAGIPNSDWIISVKEKLERVKKEDEPRRKMWPRLCIYKVPRYMKVIEDKAYTPNLVSLGPYHHGKKRLRDMDSHKWRAFCQILKRCEKDATLFLDSIKEVEGKARECYEGKISMSSNEFVEMMVLDGCFVLELFQGAAYGFRTLGYSEDDPVFAKRDSMLHMIQRDMIMLENQIPLFVLDQLFQLQFSKPDQKRGLVKDLALPFFLMLMPENMDTSFVFDPLSLLLLHHHCLHLFRDGLLRKRLQVKPRRQNGAKHRPHKYCLHLFRQGLMWERSQVEPSRQKSSKHVPEIIHLHCVTELKVAGVKFKKRDTNSFWDIKFKNGVLKIPPLFIHDGTKSLFLNLMAFEQSHLHCGSEITSYVSFMDKMINSQEDVRHLHYCGILEHSLGSDVDVANLFNKLCQEVPSYMDNSYLLELSKEVHQFSGRRWNSWKTTFMHNYFSNPWAITSFMAAVFLLILTFLQAFFGIYGYFKPRS